MKKNNKIFLINIILIGVLGVSCESRIDPKATPSVSRETQDIVRVTGGDGLSSTFAEIPLFSVSETKNFKGKSKDIPKFTSDYTILAQAANRHRGTSTYFKYLNRIIELLSSHDRSFFNQLSSLSSNFADSCRIVKANYRKMWDSNPEFLKREDVALLLKDVFEKQFSDKLYTTIYEKNFVSHCLVDFVFNLLPSALGDYEELRKFYSRLDIINIFAVDTMRRYMGIVNKLRNSIKKGELQTITEQELWGREVILLNILSFNNLHSHIDIWSSQTKPEYKKKFLAFVTDTRHHCIFTYAMMSGHLESFKSLVKTFDVTDILSLKCIKGKPHGGELRYVSELFWLNSVNPDFVRYSDGVHSIKFLEYFKQAYLRKNRNNGQDQKTLLAEWINTTVDSVGLNALALACAQGKEKLVQYLINELGADINYELSYNVSLMPNEHKLYDPSIASYVESTPTVQVTPYYISRNYNNDLNFIKMLLVKYKAIPTFTTVGHTFMPWNTQTDKPMDQKLMDLHMDAILFMEEQHVLDLLASDDYVIEDSKEKIESQEMLSPEVSTLQLSEVSAAVIAQDTSSINQASSNSPALDSAKKTMQTIKENQIKLTKGKGKEAFLQELELLIFNFIGTDNPDEKSRIGAEIKVMIDENPDMECIILQTLLQDQIQDSSNVEKDIREVILDYIPKTLSKYCELQKKVLKNRQAELNAIMNQENGMQPDIESMSHLYKISSTLNCNAYIYLTPSLKTQSSLKERVNEEYWVKVIKLLNRPIRFIKAKSDAESGIKTYSSITKIKLAEEDPEIILEPHTDKFGNLLFIAKDIVDHKDLERETRKYAKYMVKNLELSIPEIIASNEEQQ